MSTFYASEPGHVTEIRRQLSRWVADKKMPQAKADHEIACMVGVLDLLRAAAR